jgi:hypothetical protein
MGRVSADPERLEGFAVTMESVEASLGRAGLALSQLITQFNALPQDPQLISLMDYGQDVLTLAEQCLETEARIRRIGAAFRHAGYGDLIGPLLPAAVVTTEAALEKALAAALPTGFPRIIRSEDGSGYAIAGPDNEQYALTVPTGRDAAQDGWYVLQRTEGLAHIGPGPSLGGRLLAGMAAADGQELPIKPAGRKAYDKLKFSGNGSAFLVGSNSREPGYAPIDDLPPASPGSGDPVGAAADLSQNVNAIGAAEKDLTNSNLVKYNVIYERSVDAHVEGAGRALLADRSGTDDRRSQQLHPVTGRHA